MAKYTCEICGETFETRSNYLRHKQTSHPEQAPSAADLEKALSGVDYPARPDDLADRAREQGEDRVADILADLDERQYRDAADVARAFGEIRAKEDKPTDQPSLRGGEAALETEKISAARIAQLFEGLKFPASAEDLKRHARDKASDAEMEIIADLPKRDYDDMSDVAKAFGETKTGDDS